MIINIYARYDAEQSVFTKKMIGCEVHCARKVVRLEILSKK